jgi:hypothetical protein
MHVGRTGTKESRWSVPPYIPEVTSPAFWPGLVQDQKFTVFSISWNSILSRGRGSGAQHGGQFSQAKGLARIWKKKPALWTTQVIKMATHTLIGKTFSHSPPCLTYTLFFNPCNINWLFISAVLNNSWCETGVHLVRAALMSQSVSPRTQGIIQHPIKAEYNNEGC